MRAVALIAAGVAAAGSVVLLIRAAQTTPRLLLVLLVLWVLSPFVALVGAMVWNRWTDRTRAILYFGTLVLALGSLAVYGGVISPPAGSPRGFVFVVVPLVSWVVIGVVAAIAFLSGRSQRKSRG